MPRLILSADLWIALNYIEPSNHCLDHCFLYFQCLSAFRISIRWTKLGQNSFSTAKYFFREVRNFVLSSGLEGFIQGWSFSLSGKGWKGKHTSFVTANLSCSSWAKCGILLVEVHWVRDGSQASFGSICWWSQLLRETSHLEHRFSWVAPVWRASILLFPSYFSLGTASCPSWTRNIWLQLRNSHPPLRGFVYKWLQAPCIPESH